MTPALRIEGAFFGVAGVLLLVGAGFPIAGTLRFVRGSVVVPGRVTRLNAGGSYPEIAFTTLWGECAYYPQGGWL